MIDHSMLCSSQDHLRTGTRDLDHPVLDGLKNTDKSGDVGRRRVDSATTR
jgi:hypothetical protein